jgi:polyferredoxin
MNKHTIASQGKISTRFSEIIENHGIWIVYLIAFLSILFAVLFDQQHWIMLIPIGVFLFYDSRFRWFRAREEKWHKHGRDKKETLESIRMASQYTSFFIAIIAVSLSIVLEKSPLPLSLTNLLANGFVKSYGLVVLALSGVVLLFIPIAYSNNTDDNEPSRALKNCFFCVLLMEKIIILLLVYLIIAFTKVLIAS